MQTCFPWPQRTGLGGQSGSVKKEGVGAAAILPRSIDVAGVVPRTFLTVVARGGGADEYGVYKRRWRAL